MGVLWLVFLCGVSAGTINVLVETCDFEDAGGSRGIEVELCDTSCGSCSTIGRLGRTTPGEVQAFTFTSRRNQAPGGPAGIRFKSRRRTEWCVKRVVVTTEEGSRSTDVDRWIGDDLDASLPGGLPGSTEASICFNPGTEYELSLKSCGRRGSESSQPIVVSMCGACDRDTPRCTDVAVVSPPGRGATELYTFFIAGPPITAAVKLAATGSDTWCVEEVTARRAQSVNVQTYSGNFWLSHPVRSSGRGMDLPTFDSRVLCSSTSQLTVDVTSCNVEDTVAGFAVDLCDSCRGARCVQVGSITSGFPVSNTPISTTFNVDDLVLSDPVVGLRLRPLSGSLCVQTVEFTTDKLNKFTFNRQVAVGRGSTPELVCNGQCPVTPLGVCGKPGIKRPACESLGCCYSGGECTLPDCTAITCPRPRRGEAVCGSDGVTYGSECEVWKASMCSGEGPIVAVSPGECDCLRVHREVKITSGNVLMRTVEGGRRGIRERDCRDACPKETCAGFELDSAAGVCRLFSSVGNVLVNGVRNEDVDTYINYCRDARCPEGWFAVRGSCYKTLATPAPWHLAREECVALGGELASIHSSGENTLVQNEGTRVWIGINDRDGDGVSGWSDGSDVDFTAFQGTRSAVAYQTCGVLEGGLWSDADCGTKLVGVCEQAACPIGWTKYENHCYRAVPSPVNWRDAQRTCQQLGGALASIHSQSENQFVSSLTAFAGPETWIGFRSGEQEFQWVDGAVTGFTNWARGFPKHLCGEDAGCAAINTPLTRRTTPAWSDQNCDELRSFVCERDLCRPGYTEWRGECYRLHTTPHTWLEAEEVCQHEGGHLVSVRDARENSFFERFSRAPGARWLGYRDFSLNGEFAWSDGSATGFEEWAEGEPRSLGLAGCAWLATSGTWEVQNCATVKANFVCRAGSDAIATISQFGNNAKRPLWGNAETTYRRVATPVYADNENAPSTHTVGPRDISNAVHGQRGEVPNDRGLTDMIWQWGQFLDHDLDLADELTVSAGGEELEIEIPTGDPIFDPQSNGGAHFQQPRSAFDTKTGNPVQPREQLNSLTAFIDASNVYGSDTLRAYELRSFHEGKLKMSDRNLLPMGLDVTNAGCANIPNCFAAGDIRVNEQVALIVMHTLWAREHNQQAERVHGLHPTWNDEQIYQEARRYVIAEMQAITVNEFLPALLGEKPLGPYDGYDSSVDASIANEFASAIYRIGHTMLSPTIARVEEGGETHADSGLPLKNAFFNPDIILDTGIESVLRGLTTQRAQEIDVKVVDAVRNFLFNLPPNGLDLVSLNLNRGREHGFPDYNTIRSAYGLKRMMSFDDITDDKEVVAALRTAYKGDIDTIDLFTGMLAEKHVGGGSMGELATTALKRQFGRLRSGDRFWYENVFAGDELRAVGATRLQEVIQRNTAIQRLQKNVFMCAAPVVSALHIAPLDGFGNNLCNPNWGTSHIQFLRVIPATYADGISVPSGGNRPNARHISNIVCAQDGVIVPNDRGLTDMMWQWGQFLDHDIDAADELAEEFAEEFDIELDSDPVFTDTDHITFHRSGFDPTTGTHAGNPREQINRITAYVDASNIYGATKERADSLRSFTGGRLATSPGDLLPLNTAGVTPNACPSPLTQSECFLAGDFRSNEQAGLTVMHTLWVREHNYHADRIAAGNPTWTDEEVYQEARRLVIAEVQVITYEEFLPALFGKAMPEYRGYDPEVNVGISNTFAHAMYRIGHTMLSPTIDRVSDNGEGSKARAGASLLLEEAFFKPDLIKSEGIDSLLLGLGSKKMQEIDNKVVDDVRNFLFGRGMGLDLAALNIQRGRDHGLDSYNAVRIAFGLSPAKTFADINPDADVVARLSSAYNNDIDLVDPWVGAISEKHVDGGSLGLLMSTVLLEQFDRLRHGDRFFYENAFRGNELAEIRRVTLAEIMRRNTKLQAVQDDVFRCGDDDRFCTFTCVSSSGEVAPIDGYGNNICNPFWGTAGTQFRRLIPAAYPDKVSQPTGDDRPNPRSISKVVLAQDGLVRSSAGLTDMVWQWGQFLDHDIDAADELAEHDVDDERLNIPLPDDETVFEKPIAFVRSAFDPNTGLPGRPRQQINSITSYIDASNVYGATVERAKALRTGTDGQLKTSDGGRNGPLLPLNEDHVEPNACFTDAEGCFLAGDFRSNEQTGLTAMHTLWVREHNFHANDIKGRNPAMSDEDLYQAARGIVMAEMQAITFEEFLPAILGPLPPYTRYDASINPGISNLFASALYRLGHTMLSPEITRARHRGGVREATQDPLPLRDAFFQPKMTQEEGIDDIMMGLASRRMQEIDHLIVDDIRNFLFSNVGDGLDLGALNIQRGRDHGFPGYNQVRDGLGLPKLKFAEINPGNPTVEDRLRAIYGTEDEIDVWVGAIAEQPVGAAQVGSLLLHVLSEQFLALRAGDRFWYEHIHRNDQTRLMELKSTRLSQVIARNVRGARSIQQDVFRCGVPFDTYCLGEDAGSAQRNSVQTRDKDTAVVQVDRTEKEGGKESWGWIAFSGVLGILIGIAATVLYRRTQPTHKHRTLEEHPAAPL